MGSAECQAAEKARRQKRHAPLHQQRSEQENEHLLEYDLEGFGENIARTA
jgi:hypothetical protein